MRGIVLKSGVQFFDGGVSGEKFNIDSDLFETLYSKYNVASYGNVASLNVKQLDSVEPVKEIYKKLINHFPFISEGFWLSKLWLVKTEHTNSDTSSLPYIPHIDYERFLKIMIYMDDVDSCDGPFNACPIDPQENENNRLSLKSNYKKYQDNKVTNIDQNEYIEYVGSSGSVLIFDTNCPHFAGVVQKGKCRRVMRFDFSHPSWSRSKTRMIINSLNRLMRY